MLRRANVTTHVDAGQESDGIVIHDRAIQFNERFQTVFRFRDLETVAFKHSDCNRNER